MNMAADEVQSANLDHHGLVAAVCQDLGIKDKVNAALGPGDIQRVVSTGTSKVAPWHWQAKHKGSIKRYRRVRYDDNWKSSTNCLSGGCKYTREGRFHN
jgi:hypothetical protein